MKSIIIAFFLLYFCELNYAQNPTKQAFAYNRYTDFINETTHSLFLIYNELTDFNQQLNNYCNGRTNQLTYKKQDIMDIMLSYEQPPSELFKACLADTSLEYIHKAMLDSYLVVLMNLFTNLDSQRNCLKDYSEKKTYLLDYQQKTAYSVLENCEMLFGTFEHECTEFSTKIGHYATNYDTIEYLNPYKNAVQPMRTNINVARKILLAVKKKKDNELEDLISMYKNQLTDLEDNQNRYLSDIKRLSYGDGLDPFIRYEKFIEEGELFHQKALKFSKKNNLSEEEFLNYYNAEMLATFNRYGGGIIYEFNNFIDIAQAGYINETEIINQFRVVYPEKWDRQIIDKQLVSVTDTNNLEGYLPNNLILLLDVSTSMNEPEKLPLLKEALQYLFTLMRPIDYISIVTYSGKAQIVLPPTSATDSLLISNTINTLRSGGGTNTIRGLQLSYKTALANYNENGNNKIIMATDGNFRMSKRLFRVVERQSGIRPIGFTIFFLSRFESYYVAGELQRLANSANGKYRYLNRENAKYILLKEAQLK